MASASSSRKHEIKLSKTKTVYFRGEEDDAIIIRSVWPSDDEGQRFGIKHIINITKLFQALCVLIADNFDEVRETSYLATVLFEAAARFGEHHLNDFVLKELVRPNSGSSMKFCMINLDQAVEASFLKVGLISLDSGVMFMLHVGTTDDVMDSDDFNSISLFPSELMKLLRYLNQHFLISEELRQPSRSRDDFFKECSIQLFYTF